MDAVIALFLDEQPGEKAKTDHIMPKLPAMTVDTDLLKKYTGTYLLKPGWAVTITLENGRLMAPSTQATGHRTWRSGKQPCDFPQSVLHLYKKSAIRKIRGNVEQIHTVEE